MKKYISVLKHAKLFLGVSEEEIESMLPCLDAKLCEYKKGECIFRAGEYIDRICVLVRGMLHIQKDDYWGNRTIITHIREGEMFGEAYVSPESGTFPHDVVAIEDASVIFFDIKKMLTVCSSSCKFHSTAVHNLFFAISEKNRNLVRKIEHLSMRSTREKLISYLSEEAKRSGNASFTIPFNRQQLADFLSVDRSAMSNELSKLRNEGLLEFNKNKFLLKGKNI